MKQIIRVAELFENRLASAVQLPTAETPVKRNVPMAVLPQEQQVLL
jgi:hypothetical protein